MNGYECYFYQRKDASNEKSYEFTNDFYIEPFLAKDIYFANNFVLNNYFKTIGDWETDFNTLEHDCVSITNKKMGLMVSVVQASNFGLGCLLVSRSNHEPTELLKKALDYITNETVNYVEGGIKEEIKI